MPILTFLSHAITSVSLAVWKIINILFKLSVIKKKLQIMTCALIRLRDRDYLVVNIHLDMTRTNIHR